MLLQGRIPDGHTGAGDRCGIAGAEMVRGAFCAGNRRHGVHGQGACGEAPTQYPSRSGLPPGAAQEGEDRPGETCRALPGGGKTLCSHSDKCMK